MRRSSLRAIANGRASPISSRRSELGREQNAKALAKRIGPRSRSHPQHRLNLGGVQARVLWPPRRRRILRRTDALLARDAAPMLLRLGEKCFGEVGPRRVAGARIVEDAARTR